MINIDKNDFLYKYLTFLGVNDIEKEYKKFAENGISNVKDLKRYIYSSYAESNGYEIEEEMLKDVMLYFQDIKKAKKVKGKELKKAIEEYKKEKNQDIYNIIVASKLKDIIFIACLYKNQFKDIELMDIIQICNIGLLKAIEKYDVNSHISFDDYIEYWVNYEMFQTFTKEKE